MLSLGKSRGGDPPVVVGAQLNGLHFLNDLGFEFDIDAAPDEEPPFRFAKNED
jgi:hypothetical protein